MSLINEALRRARVEAARRDATAKGIPASALPIYRPHRRRPWLAPLAGFLAGLVAVALAAGAFWLARRPLPAPGAEVAVAATVPAAAETASSSGVGPLAAVEPPPAVVETPQTASAAPLRPPEPAAAPRPAALPPTAASPAGLPPASAPAAPPVAAPPASGRRDAGAPSRGNAGTSGGGQGSGSGAGDGGTYLREAAPAGGAPVKVDFIVWSESQPFAQINGQLINPGQRVDGYTLLTVERERVQFEGGGQRFWIRVR